MNRNCLFIILIFLLLTLTQTLSTTEAFTSSIKGSYRRNMRGGAPQRPETPRWVYSNEIILFVKYFYFAIISMWDLVRWFIGNVYSLNNSKFFSGLIMLLMNIGSKYITIELSKTQSQYLSGTIARQLLIFSISWMGTRDIFKAVALTAFFNILTGHLFNEESTYCIVPKQYRSFKKLIDSDGDNIISDEEIAQAKKILEKARQQDLRRTFLQGDWNN